MADNQSVMGSGPLLEPGLLAGVAVGPGVRYGVLLVAAAAGLIGSAALLGHAANAPTLVDYQRNHACRGSGSTADCLALAAGTVLDDRPLPLGIHAVTLSVEGRRAVYYGWARSYSSPVLPTRSDALLVGWRGRVARVVGPGLTLEPFEGPPGAASFLIVVAIVSELTCGLALSLHAVVGRLRVWGPAGAGGRAPLQLVLAVLAIALLAGRSGHASIAAPLHVACGLVLAGQFGAAGLGSAGALTAVAGAGLEGLSEERALRLGADAVLAAVLVVLCLSLAADLVVADLLTLPR